MGHYFLDRQYAFLQQIWSTPKTYRLDTRKLRSVDCQLTRPVTSRTQSITISFNMAARYTVPFQSEIFRSKPGRMSRRTVILVLHPVLKWFVKWISYFPIIVRPITSKNPCLLFWSITFWNQLSRPQANKNIFLRLDKINQYYQSNNLLVRLEMTKFCIIFDIRIWIVASDH